MKRSFSIFFLFLIAFSFLLFAIPVLGVTPDIWLRYFGSTTLSTTYSASYFTACTGDVYLWIPNPGGQTNTGTLSQSITTTFTSIPQPSLTEEYTHNGYIIGWWVSWRDVHAGLITVSMTYSGSNAANFDGITSEITPYPQSNWCADSYSITKSDVQVLAEELYAQSRSNLDYIYTCISWIMANISYGSGGSFDNETAGSTLTTRTGTCLGMTNLFVGLARAKGIPAGVASGPTLGGTMRYNYPNPPHPPNSSYSETALVGPHAWARVWIEDQWQDFDPAWVMYAFATPQRVSGTFHVDIWETIPLWDFMVAGGCVTPILIQNYSGTAVTNPTTVAADSVFNRSNKRRIIQAVPPWGPPRQPTVAVEGNTNSIAKGLLVWPNPSFGDFNLERDASVFDVRGRLVWDGVGEKPKLPSGAYFVRSLDGKKGNLIISK